MDSHDARLVIPAALVVLAILGLTFAPEKQLVHYFIAFVLIIGGIWTLFYNLTHRQ